MDNNFEISSEMNCECEQSESLFDPNTTNVSIICHLISRFGNFDFQNVCLFLHRCLLLCFLTKVFFIRFMDIGCGLGASVSGGVLGGRRHRH